MDRRQLYHEICKDLSGTYVEVGTCWGGFAKFLLDFTPCKKLFCVDPYFKFKPREYADALNLMTQDQMDEKFLRVKGQLEGDYKDRVTMVRELSTEAAKKFDDNSLQFVYIDGNHMYHAVLQDLEAWYPKVAPGGIMAGDDVEDINIPHPEDGNAFIQHEGGTFGMYGVHTALVDFQKKHPDFNFEIKGSQFVWRKAAH